MHQVATHKCTRTRTAWPSTLLARHLRHQLLVFLTEVIETGAWHRGNQQQSQARDDEMVKQTTQWAAVHRLMCEYF